MSYLIDKVFTENIEMEYIKFGKGNKTLVILPGLSIQSVILSADLIEKHYGIFSDEYTVYLFDRRRNLPPKYTVSDMATDTVKVLKKLGLSHTCLFGVSQGGMIAMLIAADYPELVEKMALGSTSCVVDENRQSVIDEWISLAKKGDKKGLYLLFGKAVYSKKVFDEYRNMFSDIAKTVTEVDLQRFIILAEGIRGFDVRNKIRNIDIPVLLIGDTEDAVLGSFAADEIAQQFENKNNFESFMYNGYGHAVYDTAEDYTEKLYAFFELN